MKTKFINLNKINFKAAHSSLLNQQEVDYRRTKSHRSYVIKRLAFIQQLSLSVVLTPLVLKRKIFEDRPIVREELLSTKDVCENYKISERTIRRWRKTGRLEFIKNNRTILFEPSNVRKALEHKGR
jgi:hypothetical protein